MKRTVAFLAVLFLSALVFSASADGGTIIRPMCAGTPANPCTT